MIAFNERFAMVVHDNKDGTLSSISVSATTFYEHEIDRLIFALKLFQGGLRKNVHPLPRCRSIVVARTAP